MSNALLWSPVIKPGRFFKVGIKAKNFLVKEAKTRPESRCTFRPTLTRSNTLVPPKKQRKCIHLHYSSDFQATFQRRILLAGMMPIGNATFVNISQWILRYYANWQPYICSHFPLATLHLSTFHIRFSGDMPIGNATFINISHWNILQALVSSRNIKC